MSNARNLADLLDSNGDVVSGALDNVPPSNDASALTTGTLPIARIADGDVTTAKLASTLDLSGKTVTLPSGVAGKVLQWQGVSGIATAHEEAGNSTIFYSSQNDISITCQGGTSSKFVITVYQGASHCQSGTTGKSWIARTVSGSITNIDYASTSSFSAFHMLRDPGDVNNNYYPISQLYVDAPSVAAGTVIRYQGRYARHSGSNSFYYLHQGFGYGISVMEVAP
jgi:hypothetical protein